MNALLIGTVLAVGQTASEISPPPSTALDGIWKVVALEINGRPAPVTEKDQSLAIHNNTLTMPGLAAMHGTVRLDLGPRGTLRAIPAATGTGNRRDPSRSDSEIRTGAAVAGTAGTGIIGGANGVYVRTADYLVLTIGDPSAATATGTGVGETIQGRPGAAPEIAPAGPTVAEGTVATVGQPPVSLVLRRAAGTDAPPATAAPSPPAVSVTTAPVMRRSTSIVGSNVMLSDGSSAGPIQDIVYDNSGMIVYAVLGANGSFAAVPWNGLTWDATGRFANLALTRSQFGTIPTFDTNAWSNLLANPEFVQRLQGTFNNFHDADGRPVFANSTNRPGNQAGATTGVQSNFGNPAVNRPNNPPANQPHAEPRPQSVPQPVQPKPEQGPAPGKPFPGKPPAATT